MTEAVTPAVGVTTPDVLASADRAASTPRVSRLYPLVVGLSAFLLFCLELLSGRLVLPVFGGSPGVWTTALCFFTAVVFLGYAYAHLMATRARPVTAGILQLMLVGATIVAAIVVTSPGTLASLRRPELPESLNVLLVLTVIAGAPAFLLATTTPLLSAWLGAGGRDPWWLYAVSNAAAFAALLAYPFLIEPFLPLSVQRLLLAGGLVAYAAAIGRIVIRDVVGLVPAALGSAGVERLPWRRQAIWLAAAFVPAGLLAATTNELQTDLVSAPLIWVGPLAVYLLSLVVAFSERGRGLLRWFERLTPAAATLLWIPYVVESEWGVVPLLLMTLSSLFVVATAVHGRLALDRPSPRHLTRFYVIVSLGGVLATAFVAVAAPLIFPAIWEYPLLIVAAVVMLAVMRGPELWPGWRFFADPRAALSELVLRLVVYDVVVVALAGLLGGGGPLSGAGGLLVLFAGGVVVVVSATPRILAVATPIVLAVMLVSTAPNPTLETRTFFGVIRLVAGQDFIAEFSGTTIHGIQFTDERRAEPTAYYASPGPVAEIFEDLRARAPAADIGVVGLGIGTLAAFGQPSDRLTFYEIDRKVAELARDPRYFSFLRDTAATTRIEFGDGRLLLEAAGAPASDLLILDAFTSDAVPAHLITREAMAAYARLLRPGGILVFNVSNRYYDLASAVSATANSLGLTTAGKLLLADDASIERSAALNALWLVVGQRTDVQRFIDRGWTEATTGGPVLTDDYPDLFRTIRLVP